MPLSFNSNRKPPLKYLLLHSRNLKVSTDPCPFLLLSNELKSHHNLAESCSFNFLPLIISIWARFLNWFDIVFFSVFPFFLAWDSSIKSSKSWINGYQKLCFIHDFVCIFGWFSRVKKRDLSEIGIFFANIFKLIQIWVLLESKIWKCSNIDSM